MRFSLLYQFMYVAPPARPQWSSDQRLAMGTIVYADVIHQVWNKHHVIEASQDPSSYCAVFSIIGLGWIFQYSTIWCIWVLANTHVFQIVVLLFYMCLPLGQIVSSVEQVYRSLLACQRFLTTSRTATSAIGSAGLAGSKVTHFNTCLISTIRNHNVCNRLLHVYKSQELIYLIFFWRLECACVYASSCTIH